MAVSVKNTEITFNDSTNQGTAYVGASAYLFDGSSVTGGTVSENWTVPTGVTKVKVTVVGGGAGGAPGSTTGTARVGSGGGSGGVAVEWITGLTPGSTITLTAGGGGTSGVAGSTSSFGLYCSATGGATGTTTTASGVLGGAGGSGSGGTFNYPGRRGSSTFAYYDCASGLQMVGGLGGSTWELIASSPGAGGVYGSSPAGGNASGYGAGGGGGAGVSNTAPGGQGAPGYVFIEW